jgi:hypothetical protein
LWQFCQERKRREEELLQEEKRKATRKKEQAASDTWLESKAKVFRKMADQWGSLEGQYDAVSIINRKHENP